MAEAVKLNDLLGTQTASDLWEVVAAMPWQWMPAMKPADEYFKEYVHGASGTNLLDEHRERLHQGGKHQFLLCPLVVASGRAVPMHGRYGMKNVRGVKVIDWETLVEPHEHFTESFLMVNWDGEITLAEVRWQVQIYNENKHCFQSSDAWVSVAEDAEVLAAFINHAVGKKHREVLCLARLNLRRPLKDAEESARRRYNATVIARAKLG